MAWYSVKARDNLTITPEYKLSNVGLRAVIAQSV
jgi:hypothetical protein